MQNNAHADQHKKYSLTDFVPLIIILATIVVLTLLYPGMYELLYGAAFSRNVFIVPYYLWVDVRIMMHAFMGFFFLIFGLFKLYNLRAFVDAYAQYDLITQKMRWYGYVYPFIEIYLGFAYLLNIEPLVTYVTTIILMTISAAGVFSALRKGSHITCACLGVVFKIPMTYITLFEDIAMALMAMIMLWYYDPIITIAKAALAS